DRPQAERPREGAERLGDVYRTNGDEPEGRSNRLGEHGAIAFPAQPGPGRRVVFPALPDALPFHHDVARAALEDRAVGVALDEHLDLAAAGETDLPRVLVRDPVRHDRRIAPR